MTKGHPREEYMAHSRKGHGYAVRCCRLVNVQRTKEPRDKTFSVHLCACAHLDVSSPRRLSVMKYNN